MLPPLRYLLHRLLYLLSQARPRLRWLLGKPSRITIAAYSEGGYMLKIHHAEGVEWVRLTTDTGRTMPDERDFTATADALTARGLTWVPPWALDQDGNLTAPVVPLLAAPPQPESSQPSHPADPSTNRGTEDRP